MYDLIDRIIGHSWVSQGANEQQYIYFVCCAMILILTVAFIDFIKDIFSGFFRG